MANIVRKNENQLQQQQGGQALGGWDPFQMMRDLLRFDPFGSFGELPLLRRALAVPIAPAGLEVRFDVRETADAFEVRADLPGVDEKNLDISLTGNRLTIHAHREEEQRHESENVYVLERSQGAFTRSFVLPEGVDAENISADLKSGVLFLHIPKKPEQQARKIGLKPGTTGQGQQKGEKAKA